MSDSPQPLTKDEAAALRASAAAGNPPSLDILRRFIATIRKTWTAKPDAQTKGKSRDKKPVADENQIDFF